MIKHVSSFIQAILFTLVLVTAVNAGIPLPTIIAPESGECIADNDVMRRDHMNFILHQRDETVYKGIRTVEHSLKRCINCHVVKDANNQPVTYKDPKHFCVSCHEYASVNIDCFQCHTSLPEKDTDAAH